MAQLIYTLLANCVACYTRYRTWLFIINFIMGHMMERDEIVHILQTHRNDLVMRYGVKSLAIFGSTARGEATSQSDVDLLVEFNRPTGLFGLFELQDYLELLLNCPVDLGTRNSLKPRLRSQVLSECINVA